MKTGTTLSIVVGLLFGLFLASIVRAQVVATVVPNEVAESLKGIWETRGAGGNACTPCTLTVANIVFDPSVMRGEFTGTFRSIDSTIGVSGPIRVDGTKVHFSFVTKMGGTMNLTMSSAKKLEGDVTGAVSGKKVPFEYKRVK